MISEVFDFVCGTFASGLAILAGFSWLGGKPGEAVRLAAVSVGILLLNGARHRVDAEAAAEEDEEQEGDWEE